MRELNIDWAALHSAFQMNMPEVRCFLCIADGKVLKLPPGDPALATVRGDPQQYLTIDAIASRIQYQWLDEFIRSIDEGDVRSRMEAAINGKGAFRRFKDILLTLPDERRRWFEYRDKMMQKRIVEWVMEQNITPLNEAPWANGEAMPAEMSYDSQMGFGPSAPAAALPAAPPLRAAAPPVNSQQDVEAVRDYLIEWFDGRTQQGVPGPLELEGLATQIGKRFRVKPLHV